MPRLSDLDQGRAVGLLYSGLGIKAVSRFFACNPQNNKTNYQQNIELLVRSKSGRPRVTTRQDRFIINRAITNRTRTLLFKITEIILISIQNVKMSLTTEEVILVIKNIKHIY